MRKFDLSETADRNWVWQSIMEGEGLRGREGVEQWGLIVISTVSSDNQCSNYTKHCYIFLIINCSQIALQSFGNYIDYWYLSFEILFTINFFVSCSQIICFFLISFEACFNSSFYLLSWRIVPIVRMRKQVASHCMISHWKGARWAGPINFPAACSEGQIIHDHVMNQPTQRQDSHMFERKDGL